MQSYAGSSGWLAATLSSEGLIKSLSFGAEQFTGYSPRELVNRPVTHILADASAFEVPHILNTAKEWGNWAGEIIHRTRGGKLLKARSTVSLLAGSDNCTVGYLLTSNLHPSLDLNNCGSLDPNEVAANLRAFSHELNNPLAVIMGFTQLLVLNPNCQGNTRKDIEKIYSELKRVIQVVEKLHEYALSLYEKQQPDSDADSSAAKSL
jgi:nitrogen-specific signal transduction histidine kinase